MSKQKDRDELARIIFDQDTALADVSREQSEVIADAILSSAWLRQALERAWDEGYFGELDNDGIPRENPYRKTEEGA